MKVTRYVPLCPGLNAAAEATDFTLHPNDPANQDFYDWYTDREGVGQAIIDRASDKVDAVRALLDSVPLTPAGTAWKDAVEASLELTLADIDRPFDEVRYDTDAERAAYEAIGEFAETLRETSPLLDEVADAVHGQALCEPFDFGDLLRERARVTPEGLALGRINDDWCDDHETHCHRYHEPRVVRWEHLEAIAPGIETTLRGLLATLDMHLPKVGEYDNGTARRGSSRT